MMRSRRREAPTATQHEGQIPMSSAHDPADTVDILPATLPDNSGDSTATDLRLPLPDYLQDLRLLLDRAEAAYSCGDCCRAAESAAEALALIRLNEARNPDKPLPPYYREFFRCFTLQDQYRRALALFKDGTRHRESGGPALAEAWRILAPAVEGMRDDLPTQTLVYEFPIVGRLLRGVTRLRHRLEAATNGGKRTLYRT
jgi:tetratricopeptide (TPR) repeat protein